MLGHGIFKESTFREAKTYVNDNMIGIKSG